MKRLIVLMFVVSALTMSGCCLSQIDEDLAQNAVDSAEQTRDDVEMLSGWLEQSMQGDNSWNTDEEGEPIWESEKDSIELNAEANVAAAKELLKNAKEANED